MLERQVQGRNPLFDAAVLRWQPSSTMTIGNILDPVMCISTAGGVGEEGANPRPAKNRSAPSSSINLTGRSQSRAS